MTAVARQSPPSRVVLCADDFGLTEGVSRGILALADMGRISATSAMTNGRWWKALAGELRVASERIGVGLHLNLTTGRPVEPGLRLAPQGSFPPLAALLGRSLARALPSAEVKAEIRSQLRTFADTFGRMPDFVDGHQHVHVLPGIRGPLLEVLAGEGLSGRLWIRDPADAIAAILQRRLCRGKALAVAALATGFGGTARARGFVTNAGFSGFSDFGENTQPARVFDSAFTHLGPRPVVMCHPGRIDAELRGLDPAVESRAREVDYLASDAFRRLLDERRIELVPAPA